MRGDKIVKSGYRKHSRKMYQDYFEYVKNKYFAEIHPRCGKNFCTDAIVLQRKYNKTFY